MYEKFVQNSCLLQNEMGFQHGLAALWRVVAETEAIISRAFPPRCRVQIYSDSKTRGPHFFASTSCHTRQLPSTQSTVSSRPCCLCFLLGRLWNGIEKKKKISLFSATVMKIAYGIDVQDNDDPYISLAEEALHGLNQAATPGAFWVDLFPILKYVPSWFPGAGFQRKAAYWREVNATMVEKPFRYVKEQLVGKPVF